MAFRASCLSSNKKKKKVASIVFMGDLDLLSIVALRDFLWLDCRSQARDLARAHARRLALADAGVRWAWSGARPGKRMPQLPFRDRSCWSGHVSRREGGGAPAGGGLAENQFRALSKRDRQRCGQSLRSGSSPGPVAARNLAVHSGRPEGLFHTMIRCVDRRID